MEYICKLSTRGAGHDANSRYVRGILDGGSQQSFIKDLAMRLRLKIVGETRIAFNTFGGGTTSSAEKRKIMELPLRSRHHAEVCTVQAIIVPFICHDVLAPSIDNNFVRQLRLKGKFLADERCFIGADSETGLCLLVRSGHLWQVLTGELERSTDIQRLVPTNSTFGWTLQGPCRYKAFVERDTNLMVCALQVGSLADDEETSQILQSFWQLEAMGITDETNSIMYKSLERFHKTISKSNGRYTVALLWKEERKHLLGR